MLLDRAIDTERQVLMGSQRDSLGQQGHKAGILDRSDAMVNAVCTSSMASLTPSGPRLSACASQASHARAPKRLAKRGPVRPGRGFVAADERDDGVALATNVDQLSRSVRRLGP
jgi:hypothetical protein